MRRARAWAIVSVAILVAGGVFVFRWWNAPLRRFDRAVAECREATDAYAARIEDMKVAAAVGNDAEYFNRLSAEADEMADRAEAACAEAREILEEGLVRR